MATPLDTEKNEVAGVTGVSNLSQPDESLINLK